MMKKMLKTGLLFLLVGFVLAGIGVANGGLQTVVWGDGQPQVRTATTKKTTSKVSAFHSIQADITDGDVIVRPGNDYQVTINGLSRKDFSIQVRQGKLTITQPITHDQYFSMRVFDFERGHQVVITVPHNTKLQSVSLAAKDGDVTLSEQTMTDLAIDSSDGDVTLTTAVVSGTTTIKALDGDVTVNDSQLQKTGLTSRDGDVVLRQVTLTGGTIDLSDGDFTAHDSIFNKTVRVSNSDGDNTVTGADQQKGYTVHSADDDNSLFGKHQEDGGTLTHNADAADHLYLNSSDGDNSVR